MNHDSSEQSSDGFDLLIAGGRVIDPESKLDAVCNVGITAGVISYVGPNRLPSAQTLDAEGLIVSPGFIDLHSHAVAKSGMWLQAMDGVTTALELEAGALRVRPTVDWMQRQGRSLNFGFSASWTGARMQVLDGLEWQDPSDMEVYRTPFNVFADNQKLTQWRRPATESEVSQIVGLLREEIREGALGIGCLLGYVPLAESDELTSLGSLAAEFDVPLWVHARHISPTTPNSALDAVNELIELSNRTGAQVHLCHMNSTSGRLIDAVTAAVTAAQENGTRISTEAYPYPYGSTVIGADFLDPQSLVKNGLGPRSVVHLPTLERVADETRLRELRESEPGDLCLIDFLDGSDPEHRAALIRALTLRGAAIASDSIPISYIGPLQDPDYSRADEAWPIPQDFVTHPRSAGCFARSIRLLVHEAKVLSLMEVIEKSTLIPANLLTRAAPGMASKGRIRVGADADITIFDLEAVTALATPSQTRPSTGFAHVLVQGVPVVAGGELVQSSQPGSAVLSY
jgi:N-acyl-D-aspartate/D-glutamate deacylase